MNGPVWLIHIEGPPGEMSCCGEPYEPPRPPQGATVALCTGCGIVGDRLSEAREQLLRAERQYRRDVALLILAAGAEIKVSRRMMSEIDLDPLVTATEDFYTNTITYRYRVRVVPPTRPDPERS
jgi:hypothetical protein